MSEKKIVVPEGMLDAFMAALLKGIPYAEKNARWQREAWRRELTAVLRWLSENPIVPSKDELERMYTTWSKSPDYSHPVDGRYAAWVHAEWQRRMFLAPEPEYPEDVLELLRTYPKAAADVIVAAYRLGQRNPSGK